MPANARKTATLELPKPGQQPYEDDDGIETEIYEITKQTTVAMLKDRLELYGLARDGKRDMLIGRLEEFARCRTAWRSLFQPQSKRKRGLQTGKRKESHSAKRVSAMFNSDDNQPIAHQYRFEGTHRPIVQGQTQFQEMQLDDWTDSALADCGDANWQQSAAATAAHLSHQTGDDWRITEVANSAAEEAELSDDRGYSARATLRRILLQIKDINQALQDKLIVNGQSVMGTAGIAPWTIAPTTHTHLAPLPAHVNPPQLPTPSPAPDGMVFPTTSPTVLAPAQLQGMGPMQASSDRPLAPNPLFHQSAPPQYPMADSTIPDEHMITLQLDKTTLTIDRRQIPANPPTQHFSNQISKLFSEWETGTLLQISGQYIPLKHWPKIYHARAGGERGVWDALKVEFANWKYLVEEKECLGSEEAFWAMYSKEDGTRLCYQHILKRLKQARADCNQADADAARRYFGQDLQRGDTNGAFQYGKKGKRMVFVKDQAIAEAWRKLRARDPIIAAGWEAMQIADLLTSLNIPLNIPLA